MTLTQSQFNNDCFMYVLTYIVQFSSPTINDFGATSNDYAVYSDGSGNCQIGSWSVSSPSSQPSPATIMSSLSPSDLGPVQAAYGLQQTTPIFSFPNNAMTVINENSVGIPLYTLGYNTGTGALLIKTGSTTWTDTKGLLAVRSQLQDFSESET